MRTTVSIDDEIYEAARRIAFESRRTLGDVVNELLGRGLAASGGTGAPRKLGALRGAVWLADDFDETPADVVAAMETPMDPSNR